MIKSTDIQNTLQRAFAKAIAMHGIGLYVYRGEDFPEDISNKSNDAPRTKTYQADDKPCFNKPELAAMKANKHLIESSEDAIRIAKVKYKVSKEMEEEINNLF